MSTLYFTGFESGDTSEISNLGTTQSVQATTKRTGGYALQCNPTTTAVGYAQLFGLATSGVDTRYSAATAYYRFYFQYGTKPSANDEEMFTAEALVDSVPTQKLVIRLNSDGKLSVYDSVNLLLGTGATVLSSGTWYRIEVSVGTGLTADWELKINGTSEIDGTAAIGVDNNGSCVLGKFVNQNGNTVNFYYDDFLVSNSAFPGAGQCEVMQIDGDGTYTTWTIGAGAGSDWQNIEEIPHDSDTTYLLSTLTAGNASTGTLESAASAGISGTINCVKSHCVVKRDGAANGTMQLRLRSGTTDDDTVNASSTANYVVREKLYDTDPADAGAWTTTDLDGIEVGIEEREATDKTRCTMACVFVDFTPAAVASTKRSQLMMMGVS